MANAWLDPEGKWLQVSTRRTHGGDEPYARFTDNVNEAYVASALPLGIAHQKLPLTKVEAWAERRVYIGAPPADMPQNGEDSISYPDFCITRDNVRTVCDNLSTSPHELLSWSYQVKTLMDAQTPNNAAITQAFNDTCELEVVLLDERPAQVALRLVQCIKDLLRVVLP